MATAGPFTDIHPEQAYPDPAQAASGDPYTGLISRVQEKLRELGFDAGPANGDFGEKTQAALGQFQLAADLPVSGQLDDQTLAGLGVQRDAAQASAGASADSAPEEKPKEESEAKPSS
ncbi:MAG TPA: peptidoglycan-binding domain-containing protein [Burkholderiales bacterium]|jgi:peptidoglycan hydrolase-like protein with peptidoglycan-binding domain